MPVGGHRRGHPADRDDHGRLGGRHGAGRRRACRSGGHARNLSNTEAIGRVLYTDYIYFFQAAGLVLLVAMIGAIVLTLRHKPGVKPPEHRHDQVGRTPDRMESCRSSRREGIAE
jgi:hypothetical protein